MRFRKDRRSTKVVPSGGTAHHPVLPTGPMECRRKRHAADHCGVIKPWEAMGRMRPRRRAKNPLSGREVGSRLRR